MGGSPFENVVTILPSGTVLPHVSISLIASGVGHDVGAEKLLTSPVCVGTSVPPAQSGPACGVFRLVVVVDPAAAWTLRVTFTVRTADAEKATLTLPR